jgi:hypothetical protein
MWGRMMKEGSGNDEHELRPKVEYFQRDGNRSRGGACPPPRNVAAQEIAIQNSLKSATLWGGETRQIAVSRSPSP